MKRPRALVFQCLEYECAHTRECLVIRPAVPAAPVPLELAGRAFDPGTRFEVLGSRKTSAGFETLDFRGFSPLEYVGQFENLDGRLALFRAGEKPAGGWFAWHVTEFGLIWGTDSRAGRIIVGDKIKLAPKL